MAPEITLRCRVRLTSGEEIVVYGLDAEAAVEMVASTPAGGFVHLRCDWDERSGVWFARDKIEAVMPRSPLLQTIEGKPDAAEDPAVPSPA